MASHQEIKDVQQVEDLDKKTFLFACMDAHGHLNALIGMANYLRCRGHRTAFLFTGKFPVPGDHEVFYTDSIKPKDETASEIPAEEKFKHLMFEFARTFLLSPKEVNEFVLSKSFPIMYKTSMIEDAPYMEKMVDMIKPDVLIVDHLMVHPVLARHPKFVRVQSASPLSVWRDYYPELPPEYYGLPTEAPKDLIEEYNAIDIGLKKNIHSIVKEFCEQYNVKVKENAYIVESPNLNIYVYPSALDYLDVCPQGLPNHWLHCDDLVRRDFNDKKSLKKEFKVPELIANKPGKLIFVSMGTLASMDIDLMKRLVKILSHSPNKFIFAKGICHDMYELNEDNMWGEKFVDQLTVLQNVDLVITHGGNNTITECLYYGVGGLIVCPLFGDQQDNAQRIEEKGLGVKLHPYKATQDDFLNAIDKLLSDKNLKPRMREISENLRKNDNVLKACLRLEELALK